MSEYITTMYTENGITDQYAIDLIHNNEKYYMSRDIELYGQIYSVKMDIPGLNRFSVLQKGRVNNKPDLKITGDGEKFCIEILNFYEFYTDIIYESLGWKHQHLKKRSIHIQKAYLHNAHVEAFLLLLWPQCKNTIQPKLCKKFINLGLNVKPNLLYVVNISTDDFIGVHYNGIFDRIEYGNGEGSVNVDVNLYFKNSC